MDDVTSYRQTLETLDAIACKNLPYARTVGLTGYVKFPTFIPSLLALRYLWRINKKLRQPTDPRPRHLLNLAKKAYAEADLRREAETFFADSSVQNSPVKWHVLLLHATMVMQVDASDPAAGFRLFKLAADEGLVAMAQYNVGVCYQIGSGVQVDLYEAVRYYRLSADQGIRYAIGNLAVCYVQGAGGLDRDVPLGVEMIRSVVGCSSKSFGYTLAVVLLYSFTKCGSRTCTGCEGCSAVKEGLGILLDLAATGHGPSREQLGKLYLGNCGITRDERNAWRWFLHCPDTCEEVRFYCDVIRSNLRVGSEVLAGGEECEEDDGPDPYPEDDAE
ncbi:hypothetical protein Pelo_14642 [Pelomyxa schiedti]|nr:hypothetical protein Pelo_14642 [Pelomyxa schiedti]